MMQGWKNLGTWQRLPFHLILTTLTQTFLFPLHQERIWDSGNVLGVLRFSDPRETAEWSLAPQSGYIAKLHDVKTTMERGGPHERRLRDAQCSCERLNSCDWASIASSVGQDSKSVLVGLLWNIRDKPVKTCGMDPAMMQGLLSHWTAMKANGYHLSRKRENSSSQLMVLLLTNLQRWQCIQKLSTGVMMLPGSRHCPVTLMVVTMSEALLVPTSRGQRCG